MEADADDKSWAIDEVDVEAVGEERCWKWVRASERRLDGDVSGEVQADTQDWNGVAMAARFGD